MAYKNDESQVEVPPPVIAETKVAPEAIAFGVWGGLGF